MYVKGQSSIQCWNSNLRPSEQESPPITTRPGFPPKRLDLAHLIVVQDVEVGGGVMGAQHVDWSVVVEDQAQASGNGDIDAPRAEHQAKKSVFSDTEFDPTEILCNFLTQFLRKAAAWLLSKDLSLVKL